jgi:hypothetical protein
MFGTENLTDNVIPTIQIYDTDGITPLVSNETAVSEKVLWQPIIEGTYFIRLSTGANSSYGCSPVFDLLYSEATARGIQLAPRQAAKDFVDGALVFWNGEALVTTFISDQKLMLWFLLIN